MIDKTYYIDESILKKEINEIYSNSWLFCCLDFELSNHNDYVVLDYYGESIIVRNHKGEFHAFQNVCPHRFNKIHYEECGNEPFICRYHGWAFDENGLPIGIPKKDCFDINESFKNNFKVTKFFIETCGKFIFVNKRKSQSLKSQLGIYYNELENLSTHFGRLISKSKMNHNANWKLLVENVLECYHCSIVHKNTLFKNGFGSINATNINFDLKNSFFSIPKKIEDNASKSSKVNFIDTRSYKKNTFDHYFIYPNLFISSTEGVLFYIGNVCPISSTKSELNIRFVSPVFENLVKEVLLNYFETTSVFAGNEVISEDKVILENIQKSLQYDIESSGVIGSDEVRIKHFFDSYNKSMSNDESI